jgi:hypothetical protein
MTTREQFKKEDPLEGLMTEEQYYELADIADEVFALIDLPEPRNKRKTT